MDVSLKSQVTYSGRERTQERKDAEKKVVAGGGAIAATTAAANTKAAKSGFDMFTSAGKVSKGMKATTEAAKTATEVTKKTKGLWSKVVGGTKWATDAIMNWGAKFKNIKFIKPIVESSIFRYSAKGLGYGFGAVTFISGMSDIVKVTSETIESKIADR